MKWCQWWCKEKYALYLVQSDSWLNRSKSVIGLGSRCRGVCHIQSANSMAMPCPESCGNSTGAIPIRLKPQPDGDVKLGSLQQQLIRSKDWVSKWIGALQQFWQVVAHNINWIFVRSGFVRTGLVAHRTWCRDACVWPAPLPEAACQDESVLPFQAPLKSCTHNRSSIFNSGSVVEVKHVDQGKGQSVNGKKSAIKNQDSWDSLLVRALDLRSKGSKFESRLEWRENFLLQSQLCVLTLYSVSIPPPCYLSGA